MPRHARTAKSAHWHIDYLTAAVPINQVVASATELRLECAWVKRLLGINGASAPVRNFGNTDCRSGCPSHLIRLPDGVKPHWVEDFLIRRDPPAQPPIDIIQTFLDAVREGDDGASERAAQELAGRTDLLPALRPLLADADPDRRWWAVRTLALIGGDDAGALLRAGLTDPDEATRCAAALGLGQLCATSAISALIARLTDPSGWVRDSAGDALAMIGDPALPALVEALDRGPDSVRVRAASALRKVAVGNLADRRDSPIDPAYWPAIGALFTALNDPNRLVRHHAYETLDRLGLLETVIIPG